MNHNLINVSFLIPSSHSYHGYSSIVVDKIKESNFNFNYEIIICSKDNKNIPKDIIHIQEPESNQGAVLPIKLAYLASKGKYICQLNDDYYIDKSFENAITFLESDELKDSPIKIVGLFDGTERAWEIPAPFNFHPHQLIRWPVFDKENFTKYFGKNLYDSRFKHHDSDMYLSMYIYKKYNQGVKVCVSSFIYPVHNISSQFNNANDRATYESLYDLPVELMSYR